jgi:hypothetical protein
MSDSTQPNDEANDVNRASGPDQHPGPNGRAPAPNTAGGKIPDPEVEGSGSKYASNATFGMGAAIRIFTPVTLGKSKTFMRANLALACEAILVDATKATAIGKDLYLVLPKVADDGGLEGLDEAHNALLVPLIDRDGQAFLWPLRTHNRDGSQLQSYDSALAVLPKIVDKWGGIKWRGRGYILDYPRKPEAMPEPPPWPENLRTFDDWVDAGFTGKIIKHSDHKALQTIRGEI